MRVPPLFFSPYTLLERRTRTVPEIRHHILLEAEERNRTTAHQRVCYHNVTTVLKIQTFPEKSLLL